MHFLAYHYCFVKSKINFIQNDILNVIFISEKIKQHFDLLVLACHHSFEKKY